MKRFRPVRLLHVFARGIAPQVFQRIEVTRLAVKDVDHDIDKVQEDPLPRRIALHMPGPVALGLEAVKHAVRYGFDLTVGVAVADNEVVGGRIELA